MLKVEYIVNYNEFKGPINLLLELINKKKVDIYQIKIYDIIQGFLDYIEINNTTPLDTISEFLYIATLLLEIKASSIIPSQNKMEEEQSQDNKDLKFLREREKIYSIYKKAANYILKLKESENVYFVREAAIEEDFLDAIPDFLNNLNIDNLNKIASRLLKKNEFTIDLSKVHIEDATITIIDAMNNIKKIVEIKKEVTFKEITKNYKLLIDKIICFLSILELYKNEYIDIIQFENFGNIIIRKFNYNL